MTEETNSTVDKVEDKKPQDNIVTTQHTIKIGGRMIRSLIRKTEGRFGKFYSSGTFTVERASNRHGSRI
jgi:hypothetical protein